MVELPSAVKPYEEIDIATMGTIFQNISSWLAMLVNALGLPVTLNPLTYNAVDYNDIIATTNYYGSSLNAIIDAANERTQ